MPKNIIPKDNIPKIYEVREVENQIPSYEEFLKTYQQERVNYGDLTYTDISSNKNYGPMWGNGQHGERWTDLRIFCPVSGCNNRSVVNQTHTCGGQVEFSNKARIRCRSCGTISRVRDFEFSCSNNCRGHTSMVSFTDAIIMALEYGNVEKSFATELLQSLRDSYRN